MSIHTLVRDRIEDVSKAYYDLGELFYKIFDSSAYEELGYVGQGAFAKYCTEELGYNHDSALERVRIYKTFYELGITKEELEDISFSKALKLVPIINHDNKQYWLDLAKKLTVKELRAEIKNLVGNIAKAEQTDMDMSVQDRTLTIIKFKFADSDADFVQKALSEADQHYDCGGNLNLAFKHLLQDYATVFHNKNITLENALAIINDRHGVNVTLNQALATKGVKVNA